MSGGGELKASKKRGNYELFAFQNNWKEPGSWNLTGIG